MEEKDGDRHLHIQTSGIRDWGIIHSSYNRYEPTSYAALETLFEQHKLEPDDHFVDFGCGSGRVTFYVHHRFHIPTTGIEAHDKTFQEAVTNKKSYEKKYQHIKAPLTFQHAFAEEYSIDANANVFYFFNPFSVNIFKQVIMNIIKSHQSQERKIKLILYYPLPIFEQFLQTSTPFQWINEIKVPRDHNKYGKFIIYQMT
ncbi:SAM-dependent methyltransferase [Ornithinibacillus sp. 4-3]|uniref:SAM-dependent methyltransferase n=1 Tax=Ornithinibacillus sp. 4-3 TaxID=3231488 RepID=A0AB39HKZ4_9BACI